MSNADIHPFLDGSDSQKGSLSIPKSESGRFQRPESKPTSFAHLMISSSRMDLRCLNRWISTGAGRTGVEGAAFHSPSRIKALISPSTNTGLSVVKEGIALTATSYGLTSSLHAAYETRFRAGIVINRARDSSKEGVRIVTFGRREASGEMIRRSGLSDNFHDERFA